MPLDHYVTLGNSGLRVSPFCLGTMTFGQDWGWGSTEDESHKIMDRFCELGGNFIDTANFYTKGHSELIIGDYISKRGFRRDKLVLATKFFSTLYPGDPNAGGANRKSLIAACEKSLKRLQTDYIDLYWMHCWDKFTPIEETMSALDDLVRSGKVRYIGFSDTPAWKTAQAQMIAHFRGWAPLVALQVEYSLLERTVEGELMPMAQELGLGVTPWSPLKYGVLSGKYTRENHSKQDAARGQWITPLLNDKTYDLIDELVKIAGETKSTPARVSLAWLMSKPGVTSPIIGATKITQLEDNIAALDLKLTAEQIARIDEMTTPSLNFPYDFVARAGAFRSAGTTINGETSGVMKGMHPESEKEVYEGPLATAAGR